MATDRSKKTTAKNFKPKSGFSKERHTGKKVVTKKVSISSGLINLFRFPNNTTKLLTLFIWSVAFTLLYIGLNKQFTGPIVLSDEVGYLTKAAAFAGHITDSASSWHAGYSIFISPAFMLFKDPSNIWLSIVVINSLLFLAAFILAYNISTKLFPKKNFWVRTALIALLALYPGWLVISGYSFSTPAFLFIFLLLVKFTTSPIKNRLVNAILMGVLSGFLYWIHPIAIGVVLSLIAVEMLSVRTKKEIINVGVLISVSVLMVLFYAEFFNPWLNDLLTPDGYTQDLHYEEVRSSIESLKHIGFWRRYFLTVLGQTSYLLIATLGILIMSAPLVVSKIKNDLKSKGRKINQETKAVTLSILAVVSTLFVGSMMFNITSDQYRPDMWIYGRYTEMLLLPMLMVSVFTKWRKKYFLLSVGIILLSAFLLDGYVSSSNTSEGINYVNLMSFWPLPLNETIDYLRWFSLAALVVTLLVSLPKKTMLVAFIPLSLISVSYQFNYHNSVLNDPRLAKKTALVDSVRSGLLLDDCIAFEPELPKELVLKQRNRLYAYYLYDYELSRMSYEEWKANDCGAYLSYDIKQFKDDEYVQIIGKVELTGLYLIVKKNAIGKDNAYDKNTQGFYLNTGSDIGQECVLSGCFDRSAKELVDLVGGAGMYDPESESILTKSTSGNFIHGPYAGVKKGSYILTLEGVLDGLEGSTLTISDNSNGAIYYTAKITKTDKEILEIPFYLKAYSFMLDISIDVENDNYAKLKYYSLELTSD